MGSMVATPRASGWLEFDVLPDHTMRGGTMMWLDDGALDSAPDRDD